MIDDTSFAGELIRHYREHRNLFVPEAQVREEFDILMQLHAWLPARIKPDDWLANFDEHERPYAVQMLHRFVFFPDHLTDELLAAAFHQISATIARGKTFRAAASDWNAFCDNSLLTYVTGEQPHPTDSGYLFARKARKFLGFSQQDIEFPDVAVRRLRAHPGRSVIFVDDFVGSGNQFRETWERKVKVDDNIECSFDDLHEAGAISGVFYCNAVSSEEGRKTIIAECPAVRVFSGNMIEADASFVSATSRKWPKELRDIGRMFIERLQGRYGYTGDDDGEEDWRGFHQLGLGLAFEHSTPDATLPIFHSNRKGWRPLVYLS